MTYTELLKSEGRVLSSISLHLVVILRLRLFLIKFLCRGRIAGRKTELRCVKLVASENSAYFPLNEWLGRSSRNRSSVLSKERSRVEM